MSTPILIDVPESLSSARLELRPPRAGDGIAFHEALVESLAQMRSFLGALAWVAAEPSVEAAEAFCRSAQANFLARTDMPFLLFERTSAQLVGCVGLHRPVWAVPKFELGYWCRTSRLRQGFMTEGVEALCGVAFKVLGAVRLEAIIDEQNAASREVAQRCGFALEGILKRERRAPDGSLRNTCVYARIRDLTSA